MKARIVVSALMFAQPFIIALLGGLEFKPSAGLALAYGAGILLGGVTFSCPRWKLS